MEKLDIWKELKLPVVEDGEENFDLELVLKELKRMEGLGGDVVDADSDDEVEGDDLFKLSGVPRPAGSGRKEEGKKLGFEDFEEVWRCLWGGWCGRIGVMEEDDVVRLVLSWVEHAPGDVCGLCWPRPPPILSPPDLPVGVEDVLRSSVGSVVDVGGVDLGRCAVGRFGGRRLVVGKDLMVGGFWDLGVASAWGRRVPTWFELEWLEGVVGVKEVREKLESVASLVEVPAGDTAGGPEDEERWLREVKSVGMEREDGGVEIPDRVERVGEEERVWIGVGMVLMGMEVEGEVGRMGVELVRRMMQCFAPWSRRHGLRGWRARTDGMTMEAEAVVHLLQRMDRKKNTWVTRAARTVLGAMALEEKGVGDEVMEQVLLESAGFLSRDWREMSQYMASSVLCVLVERSASAIWANERLGPLLLRLCEQTTRSRSARVRMLSWFVRAQATIAVRGVPPTPAFDEAVASLLHQLSLALRADESVVLCSSLALFLVNAGPSMSRHFGTLLPQLANRAAEAVDLRVTLSCLHTLRIAILAGGWTLLANDTGETTRILTTLALNVSHSSHKLKDLSHRCPIAKLRHQVAPEHLRITRSVSWYATLLFLCVARANPKQAKHHLEDLLPKVWPPDPTLEEPIQRELSIWPKMLGIL